jgi:hypothetical protein
MKYESTKPSRNPPRNGMTARVLLVMAMACGAFVLLSANVAADPTSTSAGVRVSDGDVATPPSERSVWTEVFATLARRADAGSVDAARLALQMLRLGPLIYGVSFEASAWQVQRWQRQVVEGGEAGMNRC